MIYAMIVWAIERLSRRSRNAPLLPRVGDGMNIGEDLWTLQVEEVTISTGFGAEKEGGHLDLILIGLSRVLDPEPVQFLLAERGALVLADHLYDWIDSVDHRRREE